LNAEQKEGLNVFIDAGCTTCHLGSNLGGTMMQKFGLVSDYHALTGSKTNDNGKMDLTKQESDKDIFKVPGLRNITKTQPYFHDGSVADLGAAVKIMAKVQFNKDLTDKEVKSMLAFLESLTGDIPEDVKAAPKAIAEK
jgi:cytochrome c peroxidase